MELSVMNGIMSSSRVIPMDGTSRVDPELNGTSRVDPELNGTSRVEPLQGADGLPLTAYDLLDMMLAREEDPQAMQGILEDWPDYPIQGVPLDDYLDYLDAYSDADPEAMQGLFSFLKGNPEKKAARQERKAERRERRDMVRQARAERQASGQGFFQNLLGGASEFLRGAGAEKRGSGDLLGAQSKQLISELSKAGGAGAADGATDAFLEKVKPIAIAGAIGLGIYLMTRKKKRK